MKYLMSVLTVAALMVTGCASVEPEQASAEAATPAPASEENPEEIIRPFPEGSFYDLLVAEFAMRRGRYDLALGYYLQQAHETRDIGVAARATRLAQFLQADKASLDAAQLWRELEPDNLEAMYTTSTMLAKNKRPMEALADMETLHEAGGKTNFASIAANSLDLPDTARMVVEEEFDRLLKKYPDDVDLMVGKALLLQQRQETEEALAVSRKAIDIDPDNMHAVTIETRLLQQLGREDEAFARLESVLERHPTNRRLRLQYARMLMPRDIPKAKAQFEILLHNSPEDADLLLSLGLISKELNDADDAELYFERLLATGQRDPEAHYYLGQIAEFRGEWQQALGHYQLVPASSDFIAAANRIVAVYVQQKNISAARKYLYSARIEHPEHAVRLYLLESELLARTDQPDAAINVLTQALAEHPGNADLLYTRALLAESQKDYATMERDLRAVISAHPDNAVALNALGYTLANRGIKLEEARTMIHRALELDPNDAAIIDSLGWAEYRMGNLETSVDLLIKAYKAFPDHEVAAHLGEVLWQLGEHERARAVWRRALDKHPASPLLRETIQRLDPSMTLPDTDEK